MQTEQMLIWLSIPLVLNGSPVQVLAADVVGVSDRTAMLVLAEGNLEVSYAHIYKPTDGNVDSAMQLVSEAGLIDVRVVPE